MPIGGAIGVGGATLGNAYGAIIIDTSQAEGAVGTMRRVGREIQGAFGGAGRGVQQLARDIRAMRGEIIAIGAAAAGISLFGYQEARNLRNYRVVFSQLTGSMRGSVDLMRQLTDRANEFGLNIGEAFELAQVLYPTLEDGAAQLDEWVVRAARIKALNPFKQTSDALRAIQEYIAGQPRSLQFLFNVNPALIQEAREQFEGLGEQIDYILERRGVTVDVARATADAWISVKNEIQLVIAQGFLPLFQAVQPILRDVAQFLQMLGDTHPRLLTFAAGITALVAAAAPLTLLLAGIVASLEKIAALSIAGTLGRVGVGAVALAAGAEIGVRGVRAVGRATGEDRLAEYGIDDALTTLRQWIVVVADGLSKFAIAIAAAVSHGVNFFVLGLNHMIQGMSAFVIALGALINRIGEIIPDVLGGGRLQDLGDSLVKAGEGASEMGEGLVNDVGPAMQGFRDRLLQWQRDITAAVARFAGFQLPDVQFEPSDGMIGAGAVDAYTQEQREAIEDWYRDLARIEADAREERLQETRQYEQQRTQIIADYELQIAREAEDFARQRARDEQRLQDDIQDIREDALDREREWWEDLQDKIEEIREDSADKIEDIEKDHARRMEELQENHRLSLLEAASRLDARAVAEENRRFNTQVRRLQRDLDERTQEERENLEERIQQEEEAHQERLEKAREADEERIQDMEEALRERQRQEDEDRRIRLQRMEQDHNRQLTQMDRFHAERLFRIAQQETRERIRRDAAFRQQMIQLEYHNQAWLYLQEDFQDASLRMFENYWGEILNIQSGGVNADARPGGIGHQRGGLISYTGMGMLHGTRTRPEYVLNPETTASLRAMLGNFTQQGLLQAVAGGGMNSRSVTIQSGAISMPIYATPNMSPQDIGREVERRLIDIIEGRT